MASTSSPFLRTSDGWLILRVQRHVGDVDHAVDAFFEFDEGAVGGEVADLALDLRADRVAVLDVVPGIGVELADAEGDLLLFLVDAEHDGFDFLADGEHVGRARDALGPGEFGDVDEAFDAFFEFDERAVRHEVGDLAFDLACRRGSALRCLSHGLFSVCLRPRRDALFLLVDVED